MQKQIPILIFLLPSQQASIKKKIAMLSNHKKRFSADLQYSQQTALKIFSYFPHWHKSVWKKANPSQPSHILFLEEL